MSSGVLALDQGSHASRACIFDHTGKLCATATVPVATQHLGDLQVEQDAEELLRSLRTAAGEALAQARCIQPDIELHAAGLAVQRSTIVCCDRETAAVLTPAISWQDRRNAAWLQTLAPHAAMVRDLTGLPLSAHYGASKIRWCLEHLPAVREAASAGRLLVAPLASFLSARLAGAGDRAAAIPFAACARVDAANAARTLLFDTRRLDWSEPLLALFAIERHWLPRGSPTVATWGTLTLPADAVPLRAVTGDQSAVPFALGTPDANTVFVNLGTGAFIQRPLGTRPAAPAPLLGSVLSSAAATAIYSLEGTVNGAGSAISWFCEHEQCAESELWLALDALPASAALPVFLNGVGGLGSPWWRADLPSRFLESREPSSHTTAGRLARFAAVVESIVFMITANAERLAQQAGPPRRVVLAGGMSRSAWLARRLAALLELPVQVLETEASARGVAQLAAPELTATWHAAPLHSWPPRPDRALRQRYRRFRTAIDA